MSVQESRADLVPTPGSSVFDAVQSSFALLTEEPDPLSLDGSEFTGFPARPVALDEVRTRLLHPSCPAATRDAVWAQLLRWSRSEGAAWTVGCAGMALPALLADAARLTARFAGEPADIHSAMLTAFVAALPTLDVDRPWIMQRLRLLARNAGKAALREAVGCPTPREELGGASRLPEGHPDLVLARAVAAGAITQTQAELIGATRLERRTVLAYARDHGYSYQACRKARARAEHVLLGWLTEQETHGSEVVEQALASATFKADHRSHTVSKRACPKTVPTSAVQGCADTGSAPSAPISEVPPCV